MTNIPDGLLAFVTEFNGLTIRRTECISTAATDTIRVHMILEHPILTAH
ncbi:MAG: hypothetical protein O3C28_16035 [Proteobacteria bacterium]|nr:hypothetical protein [Pseudomonadota bacterium]